MVTTTASSISEYPLSVSWGNDIVWVVGVWRGMHEQFVGTLS